MKSTRENLIIIFEKLPIIAIRYFCAGGPGWQNRLNDTLRTLVAPVKAGRAAKRSGAANIEVRRGTK
jgi:hypothetical protein